MAEPKKMDEERVQRVLDELEFNLECDVDGCVHQARWAIVCPGECRMTVVCCMVHRLVMVLRSRGRYVMCTACGTRGELGKEFQWREV